MATIFCFTSTGNSLYAAKKLAEKTGCAVAPMNNGPAQITDDVIGFVFPVYFWGLPRMVERFVAQARITNKNAYVFGVTTSGGPVYGVLGRLKALLKQKGVRLQYGRNIPSVTNYIPEYAPRDIADRRQAMDAAILEIAGAVNGRQSNRIQAYTPFNRLAYRLCPDENSDRSFTVAPTCTGCKTCQNVCPAKNITMEAGKPSFLHHCEHCLACVHHCPAHAIDWKQKTQGKARYRNAQVSLEELIAFHRQHAPV